MELRFCGSLASHGAFASEWNRASFLGSLASHGADRNMRQPRPLRWCTRGARKNKAGRGPRVRLHVDVACAGFRLDMRLVWTGEKNQEEGEQAGEQGRTAVGCCDRFRVEGLGFRGVGAGEVVCLIVPTCVFRACAINLP